MHKSSINTSTTYLRNWEAISERLVHNNISNYKFNERTEEKKQKNNGKYLIYREREEKKKNEKKRGEVSTMCKTKSKQPRC